MGRYDAASSTAHNAATYSGNSAQRLHVPRLRVPPQPDALYNHQPWPKKQRLADNMSAAGYVGYDHGQGDGYGYH